MPFALADIYNVALSLIGNDGGIADPDNDQDTPAKACRTHWPMVREEILRDFVWPRLRVNAETLALISSDPNGQWSYSYAAPANYARILRVLDADSPPIDTPATQAAYLLGTRTDGSPVLFTNVEDALVDYTLMQTNVAYWDGDMVSAAAHLLASRIATKFGPDAVRLGDRALKLYVWRLNQAQSNAQNEERPPLQPDGGALVAERNT
jgi:hypothetical protein